MRREGHFVSGCCDGEKCRVCKTAATHKVEETIFDDDPQQIRHPLVAYLCCEHFSMVVGPAAPCSDTQGAWTCSDCTTVNPPGSGFCMKCSPEKYENYERETLQDILSLVLPRVPTSDEIGKWTDVQRNAAMNWASWAHLSASDNDDVVVPAIPEFLKQYETGTGIETGT